MNMKTADDARCGEEEKKCLWFVPDSKWHHHIFHAETGRNTTRGRLLPSNALVARQKRKTKPAPFFFFWASQVYLKNAIVMNCRKLECVPRAPRQNLSESLTFIDPDLPLLSLFFRESLREPLRGRWNTRTAVTSPTMQLCLSRSVCFYSISVLELKIAAKTANRL